MPCEQVTVPGPEASGSFRFTSFSVSPSINGATVSYTLRNGKNIRDSKTVTVTVNGRTVESQSHTLDPGESVSNTVSLSFDVPDGQSITRNICAT